MTAWICVACAVQYADTDAPPEQCKICVDERQYVPEGGQRWTSLAELSAAGHRTEAEELEPGLHAITASPKVGIGQTALLVRTPEGNLLWDPAGYLDDAAVEAVRDLGGIAAISASHPHMYGVMCEWSAAFGGAPILLTEADRDWVTRPDPAVTFWKDAHAALPGVTLVRCGGHFAGSAVALWPAGADGCGALLTGDSVMVAQDSRWVSFMRSYPNYIPLSAAAVRSVLEQLEGHEFDRIYNNFGRTVRQDANAVLRRSADRYIGWISGDFDHLT